ncbi:hypothetical protein C0J52_27136 [Blattella germanica]|nr:hypothetical protein C0J52_27136 [Blattella germanica]
MVMLEHNFLGRFNGSNKNNPEATKKLQVSVGVELREGEVNEPQTQNRRNQFARHLAGIDQEVL